MADITWSNDTRHLAELVPWKHNPKRMTKKQAEGLRLSIERFGFAVPFLVSPDGDIYDGHQRQALLGAIKEYGPNATVDVRVSSRPLTDDERRELVVRLKQNQAGWDFDMLGNLYEREELLEWGFEPEELGLFGDDDEGPGGDPGAQLERAEALKEKFGVVRGQLWQLGRHRLMCADAYSEQDRQTLLGDSIPAMLHIDPPYGISIVQPRNGATAADSGGSKPFTGGTSGTERKSGAAFRSTRAGRVHVQHGKPSKNQLAQSNEYLVMKGDTKAEPTVPVGSANIVQSNLYPVIQGDDRPFDPVAFLNLAPITIMWGANYYADKLPASSCWIVWDKREDITRNTFADCELAWTNQAKPARLFHHLWNGLHKGSQHGERRTHPTEKPTALFEEIGGMFCPSGVWLDVFAGTGAQIIAAERMPDVQCFAMEIEPLYVATILERWSVMTGGTPELI